MTLEYTLRPISDRTPFQGVAHRNPFSSSWSKTTALLEKELYYLSASRVVLELDVRENQLKIDGTLKANASATSTAVRIAFETPQHGPLIYATDRFGYDGWDRPTALGWQENVRAIALGLEALRKVDRYGISQRGEQYRGYKAIGSGIATPPPMNEIEATRVIRNHSHIPDPRLQPIAVCLRAARKLHHPDVGGDPAIWAEIDRAAQVLGLT